MDLPAARALAEAKLREIEDPGTPLRLNDEWGPQEIEWAWCFPFDSARYFETRQFTHTVPSGPIVVNKDGSDVWVANSAPPVEQWLNQYAEEHGYPPVPMPQSFSFDAAPADPAAP
jgi:hypothetical protein